MPISSDNPSGPDVRSRVPVRYRMHFVERRAPAWQGPLGIVLLLALWQGLAMAGVIPEADLPSPLSIVQAGVALAISGDLWMNTAASLGRIAAGYVLGAATGMVLGLWLGFSRVAERVGLPVAGALYPIPKLAIIPLIILWVGAGEASKVLVIAAEVLFPVLFNTYAGVRNTDPALLRAAVSFGASRRTLVWRVILPASLPTVFAGLRIGAGLSLLVLVAAEMIGAQHGLGAMILQYSSLMLTANVLVGVVVLSALGLLISRGLAWLERRLLPWQAR
ncbi:ABC transporter permease [Alicyclobacillus sp.]|uniref:ABC transporter permease n=1 Tax=Alicyclobacillus sp. TaxID=61169 RepID=UPI0025BBB67E|nr:ABC transporter permease [Alicyclobacillus sp.]MCL6516337.1 ABC transporter permease [Alicyclobacillus sp.]